MLRHARLSRRVDVKPAEGAPPMRSADCQAPRRADDIHLHINADIREMPPCRRRADAEPSHAACAPMPPTTRRLTPRRAAPRCFFDAHDANSDISALLRRPPRRVIRFSTF